MTLGLTLPFVTEADPDRAGEGSLDPLGLARLADRLADELAPEVTARMSRIRFVTAIAVGAQAMLEPADWVGADGTPAYLGFEWHVVEAFVRHRPASGVDAVPGINKANARLRPDWGRHLDAGSYLQTPKVFGFHGVYKRLAKDLGVVDDRFILLGNGEHLVRTWEREQGLEGFAQGSARTAGGKLRTALQHEIRQALASGGVRLGPTSGRWRLISHALAPGSAGRQERRRLWQWLADDRYPVRTELARLVARDPESDVSERQVVEQVLAQPISPALRERLEAVASYEAAVAPLDDGFRLMRVLASNRTPTPVAAQEVGAHPAFQRAARVLPSALRAASEKLEVAGLATELETALGQLAEDMTPEQLVEAILDRHDEVQAAKGKRWWFERDERGFAVRGIGRIDEPYQERTEYLHPYRIYALKSFARDLRPSQAQR